MKGGSYFPYVDARSGASRPVDGGLPAPPVSPPARIPELDEASDYIPELDEVSDTAADYAEVIE